MMNEQIARTLALADRAQRQFCQLTRLYESEIERAERLRKDVRELTQRIAYLEWVVNSVDYDHILEYYDL